MGSSGFGKTTLLNVISTIDDVTEGNILLSGTDITQISDSEIAQFRRENLGFIFQDYNLLDTLTIHENIALALTINRVDSNAIDQKVLENMEWEATVLMVTHDAFSASYCKRILFLKDGRIFNEIKKGEKQRQQFYNDILKALEMFGGGLNET